MRLLLFLVFVLSVISCNASDFMTVLKERHSENLEIYYKEIHPIFVAYGDNVMVDGKVNMKKFVSQAGHEDIIKVLIGLKTIIPESYVKDLRILEEGFYLFHFKSKSRECAEFMMTLPNGPAELESFMRRDRQVTFDLVHKITISQRGNNEIISMALQMYTGEDSFVNEEIMSHSYSVHSYTYLLHEACANGNTVAVRLFMNYGADPSLLAGNSMSGRRRCALHFAISDRNGVDTLEALLERYEPILTDDAKKNLMQTINLNHFFSEELKSAKIEVLKRFRLA